MTLWKLQFPDKVDKFREFDLMVNFLFADVIEHKICHMDVRFATVDILDPLIKWFVICPQEILEFNVLIVAE